MDAPLPPLRLTLLSQPPPRSHKTGLGTTAQIAKHARGDWRLALSIVGGVR